MLVLMGGGGGGGFVTILVQRSFLFVSHWATYKNRLDAVLGVDQIVSRDKPVKKESLSISFLHVSITLVVSRPCAVSPPLPPKKWLPFQQDFAILSSHVWSSK